MNTVQRIHHYLKEREQSIKAFLTGKKETSEAEELHHLRLEIKKTRATVSLLSAVNKGSKIKERLGPYRALFKQAGKIRELQLHESYLKKHKILPEVPAYKKLIQAETNSELRRLMALKKDKSLLRLAKTTLVNGKEQLVLNEEKLRDHLMIEQEHILHLLKKDKLKISETHDLRKRIKSYHFLSTLLPPRKKLLKGLDRFQELLGKWHDYEVFGEELKKAEKLKQLPVKERRRISRLKPKVIGKRNALFQKIDKKRFDVASN